MAAWKELLDETTFASDGMLGAAISVPDTSLLGTL